MRIAQLVYFLERGGRNDFTKADPRNKEPNLLIAISSAGRSFMNKDDISAQIAIEFKSIEETIRAIDDILKREGITLLKYCLGSVSII